MKEAISMSERRLVRALQLLGDMTRFKIFKTLCAHQELCVSEIASGLQVSPSAVSQHFRQFEMLGLVSKERNGQKICYVLNDDDPLVSKLKEVTNKEELV